jgi:hypothetical protein
MAFLAVLWGAQLEAATVMIVRPPSPAVELTETVSRLHGELLSVGFAVTIVDRGAAGGSGRTSTPEWLERLALDHRSDAAFDVIGDAHLEAIDVWVFQAAPRVTRVPLDWPAQDGPARVAIRAIDLVRSMLIENDLGTGSQRTAPVAVATGTPARPRLGFELGAAVLASLDGVGPSILPIARVAVPAGSRFVLQGEVAGFGTQSTVGTPDAGAHIAQQYGLVGACVCAPSASRLHLVLGLAAGALRTVADGHAGAPLQAHSIAQWSFLLEASAGARLRLTEHTHLTLAAHVQLADPYVEIRVVNAASVTSGRPNLLFTAALGEWL